MHVEPTRLGIRHSVVSQRLSRIAFLLILIGLIGCQKRSPKVYASASEKGTTRTSSAAFVAPSSNPSSNPSNSSSPSGTSTNQTPSNSCAHCPEAEGAQEILPPQSKTTTTSKPALDLPDVELVDQNGNPVRFYSDLVQGKLVLMNAIYTTCSGTCPMQTSIFAGVQRRLEKRGADHVQMISISLDPAHDTPERMKKFAETYGAKEGWAFLTGEPSRVRRVLEAMDLYTANPEEHTPIASVGNERSGVWMKVINLTSPDELVDKLEYVSKLELSDILPK